MDDKDESLLLEQLKWNLRENDSGAGCEGNSCGCTCGVFSDEALLMLLRRHNGDVNAASYEGLLRKAEEDAIRLPDGMELPSSRTYWLHLARLYRPCRGHNIPRADEVLHHHEHDNDRP